MNSTQHNIKMPTSSSMVVVPFVIESNKQDMRLAINVHKVLKVIDMTVSDPLPSELSPYVALLNVDDVPVPVLDLYRVFDLRFQEDAAQTAARLKESRVVICHVQNVTVGILVDRTRKLEQFGSQKVLPVPETFISENRVNFFSAILNDGAHQIYLLDIEGILGHYGLQVSEDHGSAPESNRLAGKRILVVEDAPFFLKRSVAILAKQGAEITTATNGREGLEWLMKKDYNFDLIFTDIEMPIMNGVQMVIESKRIRDHKIPILFNSAISNPNLILELKEQNIGDYIVKFDERSINEKLDKIFAGR